LRYEKSLAFDHPESRLAVKVNFLYQKVCFRIYF
jgi:hypothetical protein